MSQSLPDPNPPDRSSPESPIFAQGAREPGEVPFCAGRSAVAHAPGPMHPTGDGWACQVCGEPWPYEDGECGMSTLRPQDWAFTEGVTCVSCPDCAFTFDAAHTEVDQSEGGPYDCPACWAHRALYLKCHLCGQTKWASTPERATYLLAFHMDRRHKGWTHA